MDLQIQKLGSADVEKFTSLISVFETVFERVDCNPPPEKHLAGLLEREDFLAFVALLHNKVVGGLTAYTLVQYYSVRPLVFIYDVAVKIEWQRQGIGKHLLSNLASYCKDNGYDEMFVLAEGDDEQAIDFYRATGAKESRVVNFDYPL